MKPTDHDQPRPSHPSSNMSRFRIRSTATSLLSSGVDYLATHARAQSANFSSTSIQPRLRDMAARAGLENVVLLPGWAQRKGARDRHAHGWASLDEHEVVGEAEIELHVAIHGFVSKVLDAPSRSQRIFNQMARQLAGLPRIQPPPLGSTLLDSSSDTFVQEPEEIDEDEVEQDIQQHVSETMVRKVIEKADDQTVVRFMETLNALPVDSAEAQQAAKQNDQNVADTNRVAASTQQPKRSDTMLSGGSTQWLNRSIDEVTVFHQNLTHRLKAYWVYRSPHKDVHIEIAPVINGSIACDQHGQRVILASTRLTADSNGQFDHRLVIPWHMLSGFCRHYSYLFQISPNQIDAVEVKAKLLPSTSSEIHPIGSESSWTRLPIHQDHPRQVRLISDIDDTIKHTGVVEGTKQMVRNVFVLPYRETEVKGVSEWYRSMMDVGVGIHYVTNAPIELYGVVMEFLECVGLPVSHLVLKHYPSGVHSLVSSWWQSPGERKRENVVKILDDFRSSQFVLVGDSGELDLELFCSLAKERPTQIRAVFIRDVSTTTTTTTTTTFDDDSTFSTTIPLNPTTNNVNITLPKPPQNAFTPHTNSFFETSYPPQPQPPLDLPTTKYTGKATEVARDNRSGSESEPRQAQAFQMRLNKATRLLPRSTVFRLFREGADVQQLACQLVRELQCGTRPADRSG